MPKAPIRSGGLTRSRRGPRGPFSGYLRRLAASLICLGFAIGTMNVLVDPRGVFFDGGAPGPVGDAAAGSPTAGRGLRGALAASLDPYKPRGGSRVVKAEMLRRGGWDSIVLGSSRIETGIDPEDAIWGGKRVYNGGLMSVSAQELLDVLRYLEGRRASQELLIFVDFFMFLSIDPNESFEREFAASRFDPGRDLWTHRLSNLLSSGAAQDSLRTIFNAARGRVSAWTPLGMRRRPAGELQTQLELFRHTLEREAQAFRGSHYRPELTQQMGRQIQALLSKGYRITLAVPPVHALSLEVVCVTGHLDDFIRWKSDIVRALLDPSRPEATRAPIWDFAAYHPLTSEALAVNDGSRESVRWFIEATHFRPELGAILVARMKGLPSDHSGIAEGFGALLTPDSIDRSLDAFEEARARYVQSHGAEVRWLGEVAGPGRAGDPTETSRQ